MGSAKSGPNAAGLEKFLAHGQAHMRQMGKYIYSENARGMCKAGSAIQQHQSIAFHCHFTHTYAVSILSHT